MVRLLGLLPLAGLCACAVPPASSLADRAVTQQEPQKPAPTTSLELLLNRHGGFLEKSNRFDPLVEVTYLIQEETSIDGENGDFQMQAGEVDALIPVPITPDFFWYLNPTFEVRNYDVSNGFAGNDETLYKIDLATGFGTFVDPNLMVALQASVGIYSDLDDHLDSDDVRAFAAGLATWRVADNTFWKFGVIWSEDFKDVPVFPVAGISHAFNENWRVDILLPKEVQLSYIPFESWILFTRADLDGAEYRIHGPVGTGKREQNLNIQEIRVAGGMVLRVTDQWSLSGQVGWVVAGDHEFRDGTGNNVDGQIEPALFGEFSLGLSF